MLIAALLLGVGFMGYFLGRNQGENEAVSRLEPEVSAAKQEAKTAWSLYKDSSSAYDDLENSYNELYGAVKAYVNAAKYAPQNAITRCNSYTYGTNSVSTTCY